MALARVVSFDGVSKDRIEEMKREMEDGEQPEGLPATEVLVLHDPEAERSVVILFFDDRGRLPARRRDAERDAGRGHARAADVGDQVRRRRPHDGLSRAQGRALRRRPTASRALALRLAGWAIAPKRPRAPRSPGRGPSRLSGRPGGTGSSVCWAS